MQRWRTVPEGEESDDSDLRVVRKAEAGYDSGGGAGSESGSDAGEWGSGGRSRRRRAARSAVAADGAEARARSPSRDREGLLDAELAEANPAALAQSWPSRASGSGGEEAATGEARRSPAEWSSIVGPGAGASSPSGSQLRADAGAEVQAVGSPARAASHFEEVAGGRPAAEGAPSGMPTGSADGGRRTAAAPWNIAEGDVAEEQLGAAGQPAAPSPGSEAREEGQAQEQRRAGDEGTEARQKDSNSDPDGAEHRAAAADVRPGSAAPHGAMPRPRSLARRAAARLSFLPRRRWRAQPGPSSGEPESPRSASSSSASPWPAAVPPSPPSRDVPNPAMDEGNPEEVFVAISPAADSPEAQWESQSCGSERKRSPGAISSAPRPRDERASRGRQRDDAFATAEGVHRYGSELSAASKVRDHRVGRVPYCTSRCPITFGSVFLMTTLALMGIGFKVPEVSTNFDDFLKADSRASIIHAGYVAAVDSRKEERRLQELVGTYGMTLLYQAKPGRNMLDARSLTSVRELETKLRSLPGWVSLCHEFGYVPYRFLCSSGLSFVGMAWPSFVEHTPGAPNGTDIYALDGQGDEAFMLDIALHLAEINDLTSAFLPTAYAGKGSASQLRSYFEFNPTCCQAAYKDFLFQEVLPTLREHVCDDFEVHWSGSFFKEHEVMDALLGDITMACGSIAFIVVYLAIHTGSPFISVCAIGLIILSLPAALVLFATISGSTGLNAVSFLSLFLIIGLGADVVLVFFTFWEESSHTVAADDYAGRVHFMYSHAAFACLATTLTTAASFMANMASVLRHLREFGFFMGLCILGAYIFLLVCLPGVFVVRERCARRCSAMCSSCCSRRLAAGPLPRDVDDDIDSIDSDTVTSGSMTSARKLGHMHRRCCSRIPDSKRMLNKYINRILVPLRTIILVMSILVPVGCAVWTTRVFKFQAGKPAMFPEGHNLRERPVLEAFFTSPFNLPGTQPTAEVCHLQRHQVPKAQCSLNWCSLSLHTIKIEWLGSKAEGGSGPTCTCIPDELPQARCEADRGTASHSARFIGLKSIPGEFWRSSEWAEHVQRSILHANGANITAKGPVKTSSSSAPRQRDLVQQHWETGFVNTAPFLLAPMSTLPLDTGGSKQACHAFETCYCGVPQCRFYGESLLAAPLGPFPGSDVTLPAGAGRRLAEAEVPPGAAEVSLPALAGRRRSMSGDVEAAVTVSPHPVANVVPRRLNGARDKVFIVWGIVVSDYIPLLGPRPSDVWEFSPTFQLDVPSVQRHLLAVCTTPTPPEMRVADGIGKACWIEEFRDWLRLNGHIFPLRATSFNSLVKEFVHNRWLKNGELASDSLWFGDDGHIVATSMQWEVSMAQYRTPNDAILKARGYWDEFIDGINAMAPIDADRCWHTSGIWSKAESEAAILSSTVESLMYSVVCGFLGALASTGADLVLSWLVVCAVICVTVMLLWFVCVPLGWGIGPIEVLGLIVFIGYSITYSLHMAHKYREHMASFRQCSAPFSMRRRQAAGQALRDMTAPVFGSALTTLGATCFLFLCTMLVFVRIAVLLFAVTFFSLVFALVGLPAALLCFGPVDRCCGLLGKQDAQATAEDAGDEVVTSDRPKKSLMNAEGSEWSASSGVTRSPLSPLALARDASPRAGRAAEEAVTSPPGSPRRNAAARSHAADTSATHRSGNTGGSQRRSLQSGGIPAQRPDPAMSTRPPKSQPPGRSPQPPSPEDAAPGSRRSMPGAAGGYHPHFAPREPAPSLGVYVAQAQGLGSWHLSRPVARDTAAKEETRADEGRSEPNDCPKASDGSKSSVTVL